MEHWKRGSCQPFRKPLAEPQSHTYTLHLATLAPRRAFKTPSLPLHYGIRADIFKKSYQKMFNFKNWFLCQFSSNTWFFLAGALSIPQKLENAKMNLQISIQGGVKLKKREGGGCHGRNGSQNFCFYKCYDICFHNFCDKHLEPKLNCAVNLSSNFWNKENIRQSQANYCSCSFSATNHLKTMCQHRW